MVAVHGFKVWDSQRSEFAFPPVKGTIEFIRMVKGEIIPGTGEDVEPADLDEQGRYDPQRVRVRSAPTR